MKNYFTLEHKALYNNKKFTMATTVDELTIKQQGLEILDWEIYKPLKDKNKVIVDMGANIGMASLYLSQFADVVHSIEPSRTIYDCLVENTKGLNIITHNMAISGLSGYNEIVSTDNNPPQTFYPSDAVGAGNKTVEVVDCITIEDFVKENKIEHIDMLKIDVEGAEYEIFMSEAFERVAPMIDVIVGESHFVKKTGSFPQAIPEILKIYGFKTKFKKTPMKNYTQDLSYTDNRTGFKRTIKASFYTEFIATKK